VDLGERRGRATLLTTAPDSLAPPHRDRNTETRCVREDMFAAAVADRDHAA
jgi:hypothetical protein